MYMHVNSFRRGVTELCNVYVDISANIASSVMMTLGPANELIFLCCYLT
ncbi:hypothetical protein X975_22113, partial [Stegodyphus mimosarum]